MSKLDARFYPLMNEFVREQPHEKAEENGRDAQVDAEPVGCWWRRPGWPDAWSPANVYADAARFAGWSGRWITRHGTRPEV